jgi:hypothetical protein
VQAGAALEKKKEEREMSELQVRIVQLEPMRVASALGYGESPEPQAWEKILAFAEAKGLDPGEARFFGFNNPSPSPGSPNYGYEQWMTVGPDVEGEEEITIVPTRSPLIGISAWRNCSPPRAPQPRSMCSTCTCRSQNRKTQRPLPGG